MRVLLVDDNADAAESLAILLRRRGHEAHVAPDGERALAAASARRHDAIVLDLGLPDLDGYEVARRLRAGAEGARVVLVALSGRAREEDMRRSRDEDLDAHLVKPVAIDALVRALESAAARRDPSRAAG